MLSVGAVVKGRYQITSLIGHGGMSYVYKAVDMVNGNILAIKEAIKNGVKDNQAMEQGLVTEGRLLKSLDNPHLPRIYDVLEERDDIMIVMDFVEGTSLDKVLEQYGAVEPSKVIEWGIQICEVFHYLHTQNPPIIYRDMKPANVILRPDGQIMMIDFGTARTWKFDGSRTSDTMLIGTEGFAAPEQFGGLGQSDARTDIFCLGATLFNLVTNHSPYRKPFGITPLGNWDPKLKDCALDKIIQKCTARDPYARFQTARELQDALIAANNPSGFTRFFSAHKSNNKSGKNNKGWQSPEMKTSDGRSRLLRGRQQNQAVQQPMQDQAGTAYQAQQPFQTQTPVQNAFQTQTPVQNTYQAQTSAQPAYQSQTPAQPAYQTQADVPKQRSVTPASGTLEKDSNNMLRRQIQRQDKAQEMPAQNIESRNPHAQNPQFQNVAQRPTQDLPGQSSGYVQPDNASAYSVPEQTAQSGNTLKLVMIIAFIVGAMFIILGVLMIVASAPVIGVVAFILGFIGCAAGVVMAVLRANN